jgi:hypothetical protein
MINVFELGGKMKIAIMASFFTKGDMNIDACHGIV